MKTAILDMQPGNKEHLLRFDRYVLTAGTHPGAYFISHLFAPHNRREKTLSTLLRNLPASLGDRLLNIIATPWEHGPAPSASAGDFSGIPFNISATQDFIETCDYETSARGQSLRLLFDDTAPCPRCLVKHRNNGIGRLGNEATWLGRLRQQLTPSLLSTVPELLGYHEQEGQEWLCQTALPGRSGYVELRQSWRPGALIRKHLHGAADWLALFQESTSSKRRSVITTHSLNELSETVQQAEIGGDLWRQLQNIVNSQQIPVCIAHGDFWIRNTLFSNAELTGVVDWEHTRETGHPLDDLFFFLLSYAETCGLHDQGQAGSSRLEYLETCFLRPTPISTTAREVLGKFTQKSNLPSEWLQPMLAWYLLRRARAADSDEEESAQWLACYRRLGDVPCFAFSG
ncbi:MAG: aminoglycoside phosphotransferase family protein [Pseudomonadota bacterium]